MNRLLSTTLLLTLIHALSIAQTATLTGSVTDARTGQPLPFASVYLNATTRGTTTDQQGRFTLTAVPLGTVEVVASFLGYQTYKQTLRLLQASPQPLSLALQPTDRQLAAVTVRASRDKLWQRQLRRFEKHILGQPFGEQCQLTNAHVLNFREANGHLTATATEPLVIDNHALGYRLTYDLHHFEAAGPRVDYGGTSRLSELPTSDAKQAHRYAQNRLRAYTGSTRHLLASLVAGNYDLEGFWLFYEDAARPLSANNEPPRLSEAITRFKRLTPVVLDSLLRPARLPHERRLVSGRPLVIFYTRATSAYSPYRDARYAYSQLRLPQGQMLITSEGLISQPNGMVITGSLADDRLSTLLPADWQPERGQAAPAGVAAPVAGPVAEPVAGPLPPSVYVHIDKPFYATGDRLWLSAYLLEGATNRLLPGQTALHVELLGPTGRLVQHQWVRVADGRGVGEFRLSDTLVSGRYQLRAYTEEDRGQRGPAYGRWLTVYNVVAAPDALPDSPAEPGQSVVGAVSRAAVRRDSSAIAVQITTDKPRYGPREGVSLGISVSEQGQPVVAALSVSVTDADQLPADTVGADVGRHLAGMRGERLPLLGGDSLVGGLTLRGQVVARADGQPIAGGQLTLASFAPKQPLLRTAQLDKHGTFYVTGLMYADTLLAQLQITDGKSRRLLSRDVAVRFDGPGYTWPQPDGVPVMPDWRLLQSQLKAARERQAVDPGSFRDKTARQLAEVRVRAKAISDADQAVRSLSLHHEADDVIKFEEKEVSQFSNLYEMLAGRVAGLVVQQRVVPAKDQMEMVERTGGIVYDVRMRGVSSANAGNSPLFIIDGMPVSGDPGTSLLGISPNFIERIEVLKNAGTAGIYGMRAANGVIAFYTRRGYANAPDKQTVAPVQLIGYPARPAEFSVPRYEEAPPAATAPIDRRDVLYWKPLAQTDSRGQTRLLFPLTDVVRRLRVTVAGVTHDGRPVSATTVLPVQ